MSKATTNLLPQTIEQHLATVIDPEVGINIVDLGLIEHITCAADGAVTVEMLLTSPGCPMRNAIEQAIHHTLQPLLGVTSVTIIILDTPDWTPDRISAEARAQLFDS